jgi:uncharacterized protein YjbI with pentapeptide repeats
MAGRQPQWARCSHHGCVGVQLASTAWCLGHAAKQAPDAFDAELKRIGAEGTVDARGVDLSVELLARLLAAAPVKDGRATFTAARFDRASFRGRAVFDQVTFEGEASFGGAAFHHLAGFHGVRFGDQAWFVEASFGGVARFHQSTFAGRAWFEQATFKDRAGFNGVRFEDRAAFWEARFHEWAGFKEARFQGEAWFGGASFRRGADFKGASFQGEAVFDRASIQGDAAFDRGRFQSRAGFYRVRFGDRAGFDGASFHGEAGFRGAHFERAALVGPLLARQLVLDGAVFGVRVQLRVAAAAVCARRAQFPAGAHLRLRYATLDLDDADLAAPAVIAGAPAPFAGFEEQERAFVRGWDRLPPGPRAERWRPRLLSVRRADVAGLRLADVDLRACRFAGAHHLDRLRIEGAPLFARTAGWWRARRKTIAEEQHWRADGPGRWRTAGWYPPACQPPASIEPGVVVEPARLAALYRELRKGREDAKDEPGAADFYYGECEMRRRDPGTSRAERLVLWTYWLLSGYALRAWRALAALAAVVVLAGVALAFWGFPGEAPTFRPAALDPGGALVYEQQPVQPPPGPGRLPDAIRFSARSATALLRGPDRPLTPLGEWLDIGLRFAGPVLLGLAVLSVRGRVRR